MQDSHSDTKLCCPKDSYSPNMFYCYRLQENAEQPLRLCEHESSPVVSQCILLCPHIGKNGFINVWAHVSEEEIGSCYLCHHDVLFKSQYFINDQNSNIIYAIFNIFWKNWIKAITFSTTVSRVWLQNFGKCFHFPAISTFWLQDKINAKII